MRDSHDWAVLPGDNLPATLQTAPMENYRRPLFLYPESLCGANLRYCLLTLLHQEGKPRKIAELRAALEQLGLTVGGADPNKVISDVLRYELRLGRVARTGRGQYESRYRPNTTVRRHRARLQALVAKARLNAKSAGGFSS
ncbi:unannotated protein [freshwater metagenome]|uniref:Unannotated protein n=1 Tax=freshwater metagenome TaxID=449393 RepID=A0A6J7HGL4_9ZZZZ